MGFYGNVFYELRNAFSKLIVKHSYDNSNTTAMTVKGIEGQITLAPNNEWISLTADIDNVRCGITHKEIAAAGTMVAFDKIAAEDVPDDVATLDLGQVFRTSVMQYDKAGHVIGVEDKYLKLPITDTEAEIGTLNEDVSILKVNDANKEDRLKTVEGTIGSYNDTIRGFETRIIDMEDQLGPMVEDYDATRPWIGQKSDIAANPSDENDSTTITGVIGNIFNVVDKIGVKVENRTVSGCLDKMNDKFNTADTQIKANLLATKSAFDTLLKALKEQGIEIDIDLWES